MKKQYFILFDGSRTEYFEYDSHYLEYDEHYLEVFHDAGTGNEEDDDLVLLIPYENLRYVQCVELRSTGGDKS